VRSDVGSFARLAWMSAALVLAGCAGGSTPSPAVARASDATTAAGASVPPRSTAVATAFPVVPEPSAGASDTPPEPPPSVSTTPPPEDPEATPAFPTSHADPALEELLSIEVGGSTLATASRAGAEAAEGAGYLTPLLSSLSRTTEDLATALGADPANVMEIVAFAIRIRDVDADDLVTSFLATVGYADAGEATIAGKSVRTMPTEWPSYVYATGDTLFVVQTPDPGLAETVIAALP